MRNSAFLALIVVAVSLATPGSFAAERDHTSAAEQKLQLLTDDLRARLSLKAAVAVSIVPSNALMMSVEAPTSAEKPFQLAIDENFLETLIDDEVEAAIAHELGHVWVFTHHPYLQTEELANQIAMRAVSREVLERVYAKVWERGGTKGDLARFLGAAPAAALATGAQAN